MAGEFPPAARSARRMERQTLRIAVDMPLRPEPVVLVGACDGNNWKVESIAVGDRGYVSSWVRGLPENCDRENIRVLLDATRLSIDYVGDQDADGNRQINAVIPGNTGKGGHLLRIECAGACSEPLPVKIA